MKCQRRRKQGFTLFEMLLVLTISSSLLLLAMNFASQKAEQARRDKTALQIQQIMSASISYYLNNSVWPLPTALVSSGCDGTTWTDPTTITTNSFNTNYIYGITTNPYAQPYNILCSAQGTANGGNLFVSTTVNTSPMDALTIAGSLPMAYITTSPATTTQAASCKIPPYTGCTTIVASINIPGQNLNNARSINFAGIYYSGSCVPAPSCPTGMSPSIVVAPAGVTGMNNPPTCTASSNYDPSKCTSGSSYPILSFNAFARGSDASGNPGNPNGSGTGSGTSAPFNCNPNLNTSTSSSASDHQTCWASQTTSGTPAMSGSPAATSKYWRVCLAVQTLYGVVDAAQSMSNWQQMGKIMGQIAVFTRCVPNSGNETPAGSSSVYQWYD